MVSKIHPIPTKYKKLGKHIVVESGYSFKNGKKISSWRIVGEMWGR